MKRSRFTQKQIIGILKEHQAGMAPAELCRRHGISDATFYTWRKKYGGMEVSDAKRLKALEFKKARLHTSTMSRLAPMCAIAPMSGASPAICAPAALPRQVWAGLSELNPCFRML